MNNLSYYLMGCSFVIAFYEYELFKLNKKAKKAYGDGRSEGVDKAFQCFQQMHTNLICESRRVPSEDGKMYTISMLVDRQDKDINE